MLIKASAALRNDYAAVHKDNPVFHKDQDDTFYYIAGDTSGGAPYETGWRGRFLKYARSLTGLPV